MPYVTRNEFGQITALHQDPSGPEDDELPINHPDIMAFLGTQDGTTQTLLDLSRSDMEMARVVEDLVDVLVLKGYISMEDLPVEAQQKLNRRQRWRGTLDEALALFGGGKVI